MQGYEPMPPGAEAAGRGVTLRVDGASLSVTVPASRSLLQPGHGEAIDEGSGGARCCRARRVERQLLHDVSVSFHPGEATALMGPSTAGKTTLLNVLAGRASALGCRLTSGTVSVVCTDVSATATTDQRRVCCIVPQDDVLLPGLTVYQTLWYAAAMRLPLSGPEREAHVLATLTSLGLFECSNATVEGVGLSGGQRKLVSVALEVLTNPAVMLLDEPTSGLDSGNAEKIVGLLRSLARGSEGDHAPRTVVCALHQPSGFLLSHFDRLLLLAPGGRVAYDGPADGIASFLSPIPGLPPIRSLETSTEHAMRIVSEPASADVVVSAAKLQAATARPVELQPVEVRQ